jgi:uncharacterized repeat protein (TIGR02543 family)
MRKKIFTFLGIILTAVVLVACGKTTYEVSFDVAGGTPEISTVKVEKGKLVSEPTAPTRDGYELVGWFLDGEEWVFASDKVTKNITLVAQWEEDVTDGVDGREVEFNVSDTHIEWRYVGEETWNELIDLDLLKGAAGEAGSNGTDGREVVIEIVDNEIVWKYEGEEDYHSLIDLEDLKGKDGNDGSDGKDGLDGISVVDVTINEDGHLILTLSDNTEIDAGKVVGKDGQDGTDGLSAYEIYKKHNVNYNKTEAEWLTDLVRGKLSDSDTLDVLTYEQLLLAIESGETKIQLQNNIFAPETVKFTSLVNINFNGYTLNGNLDVVTEESGIMNITGKGTLTGNFRIDAINATINSDLNVDGKTIIDNIAPSTFNTTGIHKLGIEVKSSGRINIQGLASETTVTINTLVGKNVTVEGSVKKIIVTGQGDVTLISAIVKFIEVETKTNFNISQGSIIEKIEGLGAGIDSLIVISEDSVIPIYGEFNNIRSIVLEKDIVKANFLSDLSNSIADIDVNGIVAELNGENISVVFNDNVDVSDVYAAAEALVDALMGYANGSTLTIGTYTFTLDTVNIGELANALLGDVTPEDFLNNGATIEADYTAIVEYEGATIELSGSLNFAVNPVKANFLSDLSNSIAAINGNGIVAELDGENISVVFNDNVDVNYVFTAAESLVEALMGYANGSTLTINGTTFTLDTVDIAELANALLGDVTPDQFLNEGNAINVSYTAEVRYKNALITLSGNLSFAVKGTKESLLSELSNSIADINGNGIVATLDGENISVVFDDNVDVGDVFAAAEALVEALMGYANGSTLTIGTYTFTLDTVVIAELANALLGEVSPEEFLNNKTPITADYTAIVEYSDATIELSGSLNFAVNPVFFFS